MNLLPQNFDTLSLYGAAGRFDWDIHEHHFALTRIPEQENNWKARMSKPLIRAILQDGRPAALANLNGFIMEESLPQDPEFIEAVRRTPELILSFPLSTPEARVAATKWVLRHELVNLYSRIEDWMSALPIKDPGSRFELGGLFESYLKKVEEGEPVNRNNLVFMRRVLERIEDPYTLVFLSSNRVTVFQQVFRELVQLKRVDRESYFKFGENSAEVRRFGRGYMRLKQEGFCPAREIFKRGLVELFETVRDQVGISAAEHVREGVLFSALSAKHEKLI